MDLKENVLLLKNIKGVTPLNILRIHVVQLAYFIE